MRESEASVGGKKRVIATAKLTSRNTRAPWYLIRSPRDRVGSGKEFPGIEFLSITWLMPLNPSSDLAHTRG